MREMLKRDIYIALSTILGLLVAFLVQALFEIWYINRLIANPALLGAVSWSSLFLKNRIFGFLVYLAGCLLGFYWGRRWWQIVYVEHRHRFRK